MPACDLPSEFELRPLRGTDEAAFARACDEMRQSEPAWEFALGMKPGMLFHDYVAMLANWSKGLYLPSGYVPGDYYVAVVNGKVIGRVSVRHQLNEFLALYGGHVGYAVVPSERGRGYATAMLLRTLKLCTEKLALEKILLTCDEGNIASQRVIEKCGGVFENSLEEPKSRVQKRRYWISL